MLLFIDESGHDHGEAPYEVLAGVAVSERDLWNLIQAIRDAELQFFGVHIADVGLEFKGKKLLKNKTFRHARQKPAIEPNRRRDLARDFLQKGWREAQRGPVEPRTSEPFFVHSDLTTVVQLADIVAYCFNWGTRLKPKMTKPTRAEIEPFAKLAFDMRYVGKRFDETKGKEWPCYGVFYLDDLRPRTEQDSEVQQ